MRRVAGRLAAASGSRPADTFWPGTLPHPDLGRAPCCVEASCLAGTRGTEAGREMRAAAAAAGTQERMCVRRGGGGRNPREDVRAARRRRQVPGEDVRAARRRRP